MVNPSLTDTQQIITGLVILSRYDAIQGGVSMNDERTLFAGPGAGDAELIHPDDARLLELFGWQFDDRIGRWGWQ